MRKLLNKAVLVGLGVVFVLNVATLRKKDDPVLKTQTDPIKYDQKLEEVKEGLKEAPAPSYKWYWKNEFLTERPYVADKEGVDLQLTGRLPAFGDPLPEDLSGLEDEAADDWWQQSSQSWSPSGTQEAETQAQGEEDTESDWWDEI